MKKHQKITSAAIAVAMAFSCSMTAFAAPEVIQVNGENVVFDYEYYAANNADVAAAFGMDKDALTQHYITCGINEGRPAYAPGTDVAALLGTEPQADTAAVGTPATAWDWVEIEPKLRTPLSADVDTVWHNDRDPVKEAAAAAANKNNDDAIEKGKAEALAAVMAQQVALGTPASDFIVTLWNYTTPWEHTDDTLRKKLRYDIDYIMPTIVSNGKGIANSKIEISLQMAPKDFTLQSYDIPGYEWRAFYFTVSVTDTFNITDTQLIRKNSYWWSDASADNSKDWKSIDSPYRNAYQFTIVQDGVEYTECKMFSCVDESDFGISGKGIICMLVPNGYTGNAYYHVYGGTMQKGYI